MAIKNRRDYSAVDEAGAIAMLGPRCEISNDRIVRAETADLQSFGIRWTTAKALRERVQTLLDAGFHLVIRD